MGELGDRVEAEGCQSVAHEVFDGLDVVAGDRLLLGEPVDLGLTEVAVQGAQALLLGIRQRRRPEQTAVGEEDDPLDLHLDARPVEARLGEVVGQARDGGAVAPVERAQRLRRQGRSGHEAPIVAGARVAQRVRRRRQMFGRIAGSSCRKSARLALSIIASTSSNIPGPA